MCTTPQNFFIPKDGIDTPKGKISAEEFGQKLSDNINGIVDNPKAGPFVLGAIQNKKTCERVIDAEKLPGKVILKSRTIEHPMFNKARVHTPVLIEIDGSDKEIFSSELFGPIGLIIKTDSTSQSIALAQELALKHGAISCGAYTTNRDVREEISDAMGMAATPVSFNLTGGIYMNQNAAFSDFHVTGGNPAGNASFTNPEFINKRFTWVGHREPAPAS
jgi:acyl-CoA reductase-like NAD-dependent aldehyde dehydrogenase